MHEDRSNHTRYPTAPVPSYIRCGAGVCKQGEAIFWSFRSAESAYTMGVYWHGRCSGRVEAGRDLPELQLHTAVTTPKRSPPNKKKKGGQGQRVVVEKGAGKEEEAAAVLRFLIEELKPELLRELQECMMPR